MASKYPIIKSYLLEQIESGVFKPNQPLPPERELTSQFNVSRMTVRRAFDELILEGVAIRKRGSSVYVQSLDKPKSKRMIKHTGLPVPCDVSTHVQVMDYTEVDDETLFSTNRSQRLIKFTRQLIELKRVIAYEMILIDRSTTCPIDPAWHELMFEDLIQVHLLSDAPTSFSFEIEATIADKEIAHQLMISIGSVVLKRTQSIYQNNQLVGKAMTFFDGQGFKYVQR